MDDVRLYVDVHGSPVGELDSDGWAWTMSWGSRHDRVGRVANGQIQRGDSEYRLQAVGEVRSDGTVWVTESGWMGRPVRQVGGTSDSGDVWIGDQDQWGGTVVGRVEPASSDAGAALLLLIAPQLLDPHSAGRLRKGADAALAATVAIAVIGVAATLIPAQPIVDPRWELLVQIGEQLEDGHRRYAAGDRDGALEIAETARRDTARVDCGDDPALVAACSMLEGGCAYLQMCCDPETIDRLIGPASSALRSAFGTAFDASARGLLTWILILGRAFGDAEEQLGAYRSTHPKAADLGQLTDAIVLGNAIEAFRTADFALQRALTLASEEAESLVEELTYSAGLKTGPDEPDWILIEQQNEAISERVNDASISERLRQELDATRETLTLFPDSPFGKQLVETFRNLLDETETLAGTRQRSREEIIANVEATRSLVAQARELAPDLFFVTLYEQVVQFVQGLPEIHREAADQMHDFTASTPTSLSEQLSILDGIAAPVVAARTEFARLIGAAERALDALSNEELIAEGRETLAVVHQALKNLDATATKIESLREAMKTQAPDTRSTAADSRTDAEAVHTADAAEQGVE